MKDIYEALKPGSTKAQVIEALQVALAEQIAPRSIEQQNNEALIWSPAMVQCLLDRAQQLFGAT
jgi:hypothetical protein